MTIAMARLQAAFVHATMGIPHADLASTWQIASRLPAGDQERAYRMYCGLVAERRLPEHIGRTHLEARIAGSRKAARSGAEVMRQRGEARRRLEARRETT